VVDHDGSPCRGRVGETGAILVVVRGAVSVPCRDFPELSPPFGLELQIPRLNLLWQLG
jgi:hypothetical protein